MWCFSVNITYFLAFCWRRIAIPNHRSHLWGHHVLSDRAGKAGTRIWFHTGISTISRPQTLSSSVVLLWLLHFPLTPLYQFTTASFLCPSPSCLYVFLFLSLPFSAFIPFCTTECFSQTGLAQRTCGTVYLHLPFYLSYIVVY